MQLSSLWGPRSFFCNKTCRLYCVNEYLKFRQAEAAVLDIESVLAAELGLHYLVALFVKKGDILGNRSSVGDDIGFWESFAEVIRSYGVIKVAVLLQYFQQFDDAKLLIVRFRHVCFSSLRKIRAERVSLGSVGITNTVYLITLDCIFALVYMIWSSALALSFIDSLPVGIRTGYKSAERLTI